MDDTSVAGRIEKFRREIELIQQDERRYRTHRSHSLDENNEHVRREFRILQICKELRRFANSVRKTGFRAEITPPSAIREQAE